MCLFLQMEQVHLAADLAVVALGGFLEPDEMFGELFLVEPAGAVDAAQLRILLVAAPVCARNPRELEVGGVELARRSELRPAAHIHTADTEPIDGQVFALSPFGGPSGLQHLPRSLPHDRTGSG